MLSAQDYLAEELQKAQLSARVSNLEACFYRNELSKFVSREKLEEIVRRGVATSWEY